MATVEKVEVEPLEARKRILIEKSDLLRSRFRTDCQQLQRPAQMAERGYSMASRLRPVLILALPLIGFLLSRRQARDGLKKALGLLTFVKTARQALGKRSKPRKGRSF